MPRLTRQESQQITRQKLIEAAEKEILHIGIYEASIRHICDVAGYTLGAFYSNFKDKDELLLEVVDIHTRRELEIFTQMVAVTSKLKKEKVLEKVSEWLRELQKNKILSELSLEFEVYANHNAAFKKRYVENKKHWHVELASATEVLFHGQKLIPKIPALHMAIGLSALWNGLVMEGDASGDVPAEKIIPLFLEALLESAKKSS